jgi:hypothetical protein
MDSPSSSNFLRAWLWVHPFRIEGQRILDLNGMILASSVTHKFILEASSHIRKHLKVGYE